jgi:superfamily II DNA/RNA helicase
MDIPNIEIVVQWKAPSDICTLWQRFGRAARGAGKTAVAILLVEKKDLEEERLSKAEKAAKKKTAREGIGTKRKAEGDLHRDDQGAKRPALGDRPSIINVPNLEVTQWHTPTKSLEELKEERRKLYTKRTTLDKGAKKSKVKGVRETELATDDYTNAKHVGFKCRRTVPMVYFANDKTRKFNFTP